MRPVDKGEAPPVSFGNYQDAQPYLEKRLGHIVHFVNCLFGTFQKWSILNRKQAEGH